MNKVTTLITKLTDKFYSKIVGFFKRIIGYKPIEAIKISSKSLDTVLRYSTT